MAAGVRKSCRVTYDFGDKLPKLLKVTFWAAGAVEPTVTPGALTKALAWKQGCIGMSLLIIEYKLAALSKPGALFVFDCEPCVGPGVSFANALEDSKWPHTVYADTDGKSWLRKIFPGENTNRSGANKDLPRSIRISEHDLPVSSVTIRWDGKTLRNAKDLVDLAEKLRPQWCPQRKAARARAVARSDVVRNPSQKDSSGRNFKEQVVSAAPRVPLQARTEVSTVDTRAKTETRSNLVDGPSRPQKRETVSAEKQTSIRHNAILPADLKKEVQAADAPRHSPTSATTGPDIQDGHHVMGENQSPNDSSDWDLSTWFSGIERQAPTISRTCSPAPVCATAKESAPLKKEVSQPTIAKIQLPPTQSRVTLQKGVAARRLGRWERGAIERALARVKILESQACFKEKSSIPKVIHSSRILSVDDDFAQKLPTAFERVTPSLEFFRKWNEDPRVRLHPSFRELDARQLPRGPFFGKIMEATDRESIVLVRGSRGCGKTTIALQLAIEALRKGERVFFMDLARSPYPSRGVLPRETTSICEDRCLFILDNIQANVTVANEFCAVIGKRTNPSHLLALDCWGSNSATRGPFASAFANCPTYDLSVPEWFFEKVYLHWRSWFINWPVGAVPYRKAMWGYFGGSLAQLCAAMRERYDTAYKRKWDFTPSDWKYLKRGQQARIGKDDALERNQCQGIQPRPEFYLLTKLGELIEFLEGEEKHHRDTCKCLAETLEKDPSFSWRMACSILEGRRRVSSYLAFAERCLGEAHKWHLAEVICNAGPDFFNSCQISNVSVSALNLYCFIRGFLPPVFLEQWSLRTEIPELCARLEERLALSGP